ncbi:MAG TPA: AMP-binding protein, partial [Syntrophales bacterium]|nr:AMP-binding protein [Syntrophales bacterium]
MEYPDTTMPRVFRERVGQLGDRACVAYKNNNGEYVDISWNEMNDMVRNLGLFFLSRGIARNDKIALFAANRFEWWVADLAILSIGAVNVPIYATNSASEAEYIISNSDTRICLVGTEEQLGKILEA